MFFLLCVKTNLKARRLQHKAPMETPGDRKQQCKQALGTQITYVIQSVNMMCYVCMFSKYGA